jgi:hypothetical protein
MDLRAIVPEARPIVQRAAEIYVRHTAPWLIGLTVHGSAIKGDPIAGCSDIDMQLFLDDAAFSEAGGLPLHLCVAIHGELCTIDVAPFREIQCLVFRDSMRNGWLGPPPGTYQVLAGRLPVAEASAEALMQQAVRVLRSPDLARPFYNDMLLQVGRGELERRVRRLCPEIWPVARHLATVQSGDPLRIWRMPRRQLIACLAEDDAPGQALRAFDAALLRYYPSATAALDGLAAIEAGVAFLRAARAWADTHLSAPDLNLIDARSSF